MSAGMNYSLFINVVSEDSARAVLVVRTGKMNAKEHGPSGVVGITRGTPASASDATSQRATTSIGGESG
jgi:hypothetical protein